MGGFHLLMSYMGSLGTVMWGSGLSEALQEIYGTNAVKHVISGKAIGRALRGHFLVGSTYWCQYLSYIELMKDYITAEKIGIFTLQLSGKCAVFLLTLAILTTQKVQDFTDKV